MNYDYFKDRIFQYCDLNKDKEDFSAWTVCNENIHLWKDFSMMIYGMWIAKNSSDTEIVEFSQTEW